MTLNARSINDQNAIVVYLDTTDGGCHAFYIGKARGENPFRYDQSLPRPAAFFSQKQINRWHALRLVKTHGFTIPAKCYAKGEAPKARTAALAQAA